MQPGDADVDHQLRWPPEILGGQQCLPSYRQVRRAGGHHDHQTPSSGRRVARPSEQMALRLVPGVRQLRQHGVRLAGIGASEQSHGVSPVPDLGGDSAELGRRLPLAVDRLRIAAAGGSLVVESGEGGQVSRFEVSHAW
jgi:hypothetical protein